MANERQTVVIWILAVLLVFAVGYISVNAYSNAREKQQLSILQSGVQLGYEQAVVQIMQQAATCQPVPVRAENVTLNLIALECPEIQSLLQNRA